jgi:hypothetical protein
MPTYWEEFTRELNNMPSTTQEIFTRINRIESELSEVQQALRELAGRIQISNSTHWNQIVQPNTTMTMEEFKRRLGYGKMEIPVPVPVPAQEALETPHPATATSFVLKI